MLKSSLNFLIGAALLQVSASAKEVDQFTYRPEMQSELTDVCTRARLSTCSGLNTEMNRLLDEVASNLNQEDRLPRPVNRFSWVKRTLSLQERIDSAIKKVFESKIVPELITPYEEWIKSKSGVVLAKADSDKGIYGGLVDYSDMNISWYLDNSEQLKINGYLVGTDKLGHFIGQGLMLYVHYQSLPPNLSEAQKFDRVREFNHQTEDGQLGVETGGVYSYADLASNWAGFLFFKNLFVSERAYFSYDKVKKQYRRIRNFDWRRYVNDSWDEVLNPSRIPSDDFFKKVVDNFNAERRRLGRSVCEIYRDNPEAFLGATGNKIDPSKYLAKSVDHASLPNYVDVTRICASEE